ncbi:U32 family peptidase [bacterium]|nr:U32 family peptidase [bacterium]
MEAYHAAVEAGADAIYLGVEELNARLRARNFTIKTLAYLVNQAKKDGVRIYVTLNTLIKQGELKKLLDLLYQLQQLNIDAIIIQDLGLAYICRNYFPGLTLHASTQMAIHNRVGLEMVHRLGIKRAILSRELTMEEIRTLQKDSPVELEVFIHGALCFSISGLCLASSYLGGWSGNRGRCTQVCRRKFEADQMSGFYFSPNDLCAVDFIADLVETGMASFKIEGRMKNAEYVYNVVSSYRKLLDKTADKTTIQKSLEEDFGREKTPFLLAGTRQAGVIEAMRPSGIGIPLGTIQKAASGWLEIEADVSIKPGYKLRIQHRNDVDGTTIQAEKIEAGENLIRVKYSSNAPINTGDQVFLISRNPDKHKNWGQKKLNVEPVRFSPIFPKSQKVFKRIIKKTQENEISKGYLFFKINQFEWLNIVKNYQFDFLIYSASLKELSELIHDGKQINYWHTKLVIELPPFIPDGDIEEYSQLIQSLHDSGVRHWMCSHASHQYLFPKEDRVFSGVNAWSTNQATQAALIEQGKQLFCFSIEDDFLNIKAIAHEKGIMPIFGLIPLFISRVNPALNDNTQVTDSKGNSFAIRTFDGLYYLLSDQPLCLFHRQEKLREVGIRHFLIDFSFMPISRKVFKSIIYDFEKAQKTQDGILFNHKSGFK